jgi:hypothetical protein
MTVELGEVLRTYLDTWNTDDPDERAALLDRSVTDDVAFVDPVKRLIGKDALLAHIAETRLAFPGITFEPGGELDHHNHVLRQPWVARMDGRVVLRGLDVDDVSPDGRLTRIIGFFDRTTE